MDLEEILHEVGDQGKYQHLMLWLVLLPAQLSFGCHMYSTLFMVWTPEHWCKIPELVRANISEDLLKRLTIPKSDGGNRYSRCSMYDEEYRVYTPRHSIKLEEPNSSWPDTECKSGWVFNRSLILDRETAVTKWELVCQKSSHPLLLLTVFICCGFIGQNLCHFISAMLGKRASFFVFLLVQCAASIGTTFMPSFISFAISRGLVGITIPAILVVPTSIAFEIISSELHCKVTLLSWICRCVGVAMLSAVTYFVRDYSNIALATSVPFLAFFLYGWVFPESPTWLLSTGRYEETGRLLLNIATTNGKRLSPDYVVSLQRRFRIEMALQEDRQKETGGHTLWDLLSTPNMRRKVILLIFIWSFSTTSCLGLMYYSFHVQPGEDVHITFTACALADVFSVLLASMIVHCIGRRCSVFVNSVFGGFLCLFYIFTSSRMGWLIPFISHVLAKLFSQTAFIIINIWTREQLPVVVRESGFNFIETSSLLLPIAVPYILHQGKSYNFLPMSIFGGLQLFCSILALNLPETRHITSLQTLHDGEMFGKYRRWRDCFCSGKPKTDHKNGVMKSSDKRPQSPILGLLRKRDSFHLANAEGEIEVLECHSDACSAEDAVKVTVL